MPNPQQGSHSKYYCPLIFRPFLEKGKQCLWPTCFWTPCCSLPLPGSDHLLVFSFLSTPDPATNSLSLSGCCCESKGAQFNQLMYDCSLQEVGNGDFMTPRDPPQLFDPRTWGFRALVPSTVSSEVTFFRKISLYFPPCTAGARSLISVILSIIPSSTFYPDCLLIDSPSWAEAERAHSWAPIP